MIIQATATAVDPSVLVALIGSGGTFLTAVTSIIVVVTSQNKRFDDINKRIDDISSRIDRLERSIEVISADLKEFYKQLAHIRTKIGE